MKFCEAGQIPIYRAVGSIKMQNAECKMQNYYHSSIRYFYLCYIVIKKERYYLKTLIEPGILPAFSDKNVSYICEYVI